jgi:hypothetical protein
MRWKNACMVAAVGFCLAPAAAARAGMASPLPSDPELITRLNDSAYLRLQAI